MLIHIFFLVFGELHGAYGLSAFQMLICTLKQFCLGKEAFIAAAGVFLSAVNTLFHGFHIGEYQLKVYGFTVAHRVDGAVHMDYVRVFKAAYNMHYGVHLADMGQKFISQPFALACPLYKACDIYKLDYGRGIFFGVVHFRKTVKPFIRNGH